MFAKAAKARQNEFCNGIVQIVSLLIEEPLFASLLPVTPEFSCKDPWAVKTNPDHGCISEQHYCCLEDGVISHG